MVRSIKNLFIIFCSFVLMFNFVTGGAFAADKVQIEKKRAIAKKEIRKLKLLEKIEVNKLYRNQKQLERTEQNLSYNKMQYESAKEELFSLQSQLSYAISSYRAQQQATNRRIVQIYKTKRVNYIEFLIKSGGLNDFLDRIYFENIIMNTDRRKIAQAQEKTSRIRELGRQVESQKRYLKATIENMDRQQKNIQTAINKNEKMIDKLQHDRATWEKSERELARQSRAIEDMINRSVGGGGTYITTTGVFMRPASGPITSPFGSRMHPIFKRTINHTGIDIGARMGSPVRAANSGKVIFAGWYGGYGKVVIVNHGKVGGVPTTSLYAHLSSARVSVGDTVVKGQTIAAVGSTGYSTGPHLHFEVRRNGAPTNPLRYIPY